MAHILLAWEMGSGFGHLHRLKHIASQLVQNHHRVTLVSQQNHHVQNIFKDIKIQHIPIPLPTLPPSLKQTPAYVHILFNAGYGHPYVLKQMVKNWHDIILALEPDLLIADHAPTALLVSRGINITRINYGDGFTCPPPSNPLPIFTKTVSRTDVKHDEQTLLSYCNNALHTINLPPLKYLSDIYKVDETFLLTVPELDHLGTRHQVHYCGALKTTQTGNLPHWPEHSGFRLFAYLKPFHALPELLTCIASARLPTLVYIDGLPPSFQRNYQHYDHMVFSDHPLNMSAVLAEADLMISHGGHQAALQCAMAGVPQLHIPLTMEQQLLAHRCSLNGVSTYGFPSQFSTLLTAGIESLAEKKQRALNLSQRINKHGNQTDTFRRCLFLIEYHLSCKAKYARQKQ